MAMEGSFYGYSQKKKNTTTNKKAEICFTESILEITVEAREGRPVL